MTDKAVAIGVEGIPIRTERAPATAVRGHRIHFVDLLRLLASLQMILGHSLDALMAEELRSGPAYDRWTWVRGLTSVAFMVAAGISFHLSTVARFEAHVKSRATVLRRFRRGAWLVVLGYLLHFPLAMTAQAFRELQIADVLQCIGLAIVVLELITISVENPRHVVYASAVLAASMFLLAPLGDRLVPDGPFRFLMNYASHRSGSLFPLSPWGGFVFAGVVVAEVALPEGTRTPAHHALPRLLLCTAAVLLLALIAELVPFTLALEDTTRAAEPTFNLTKLGVVLGIVSVLAVIGRRIQDMPRFLQVLAGESLMLYVFHLQVLYAAEVGLRYRIGHTLPFPHALTVAVTLIFVTAWVGLAWHRLKRWDRTRRNKPLSTT